VAKKKSPSKGVLIFYFFPAHMQIFRPIGQSFGSRRERVYIQIHIDLENFWHFNIIKIMTHLKVVLQNVKRPKSDQNSGNVRNSGDYGTTVKARVLNKPYIHYLMLK
jgi:hypothetical protein